MFRSQTLALAIGTGLLICVLGGCEREGPAERAGEEVDEAVEESKEAVEERKEAAEEGKEAAQPERD
jgi:hypothetical protein